MVDTDSPAFDILPGWRERLNRAGEFLVAQTVAEPIFKLGDSSHLNLAGVFFGLGEIIFHLESKPHVGLAAESFR